MRADTVYSDIWEMDLSSNIKTYEFSKEAFRKIGNIITMVDFIEMSSTEILDYLLKELRMVPFGDYLKRFIYLETRPEQSFREVPDRFYEDVLLTNFKENHVPFHLDNCSTPARRSAQRWLNQAAVNRSVIFLLGFGLRMKTETVSEFLQKVLQEEDFIFEDPEEVVFWYCYEHKKPYAFALKVLEEYENDQPDTNATPRAFVKWKELTKKLEYKINPYKCLRNYLHTLKQLGQGPAAKDALEVFKELYQEVCDRIMNARKRGANLMTEALLSRDKIMPVDVEKELYAGIPRNEKGNLQKSSMSLLSVFMNNHFLSRQRIEKILKMKYAVRRFDIINLCFYLHASDGGVHQSQKERFLMFMDTVNCYLERCHMSGIHPSNPSEAFMMICLFSEMPLVTYSDVLELSFSRNEQKKEEYDETE